MKAQGLRLGYDLDGSLKVTINFPQPKSYELDRLSKLKNAEIEVEIRRRRKRRSLDANALLWKLIDELAQQLSAASDEVYLQMLKRYGWFDFIVVRPEAVEAAKKLFRIAKERSVVSVNGKNGVQLQVWPGSSKYDVEKMSRLIEGVISECKEIGCWYPEKETVEESIDLWRRHEEHPSN